jgi:UDP-N-acetylmuramoyl-L-alanine---L-glutamate ligase
LPKQALSLTGLSGHRVLIVGCGREGQALATALRDDGHQQWLGALDGSGDGAAWREQFGDSVPLWVMPEGTSTLPPDMPLPTVAVMSPGIPRTGALYGALLEQGILMTSGSALFTADHHDAIVGVTGSKGKSTTTSLVHHLLGHTGVSVALGGNMGIPVVGLPPSDFYALEYSSYQCHYLETSPRVSVISALFPEHLDWHGSTDLYYADKLKLVEHSEIVIANGDDPTVRHELTTRFPTRTITWVGNGESWHLEPDGKESWLMKDGVKLCHSSDTGLLGRHNHHNAVLALAAASMALDVPPESVAPGFSGFSPLPHRLEKISDPSGVIFVNDSLATNPQATAAALRALDSRNIALLIGGMDRGVDYTPLVEAVLECLPRYVFGLPGSGEALLQILTNALSDSSDKDQVHREAVSSMGEAVTRAREVITPGGYVVLSPAAPSFGLYRDYQHRAEDFRHWITATAKDAS